MSNKEVFELVVKEVAERHELIIKHPYNDEYMEVYSSDMQFIGGMNPKGYILAWQIKMFGDIISSAYDMGVM